SFLNENVSLCVLFSYSDNWISWSVVRAITSVMHVWTAPAEVSVVRGGTVALTCSFTSSSRITSLMSIDWTFRPLSGGPAKTVMCLCVCV
uniref:Immunoglobulin V-set domain-containing protein n=1 Tax=Sinocyclocheilus grahami TaxID=75366 RepID=A0A672LWM9_SINGR